MPHDIQHTATHADYDRGYKICDTCKTKAHIYQAGYDFKDNEWEQCKRCDSWVVNKSKVEI